MARAVGVMALGSVGEVRVVSAPRRETPLVREPGVALAMHDLPLCTSPEPLMQRQRNDHGNIPFRSRLVVGRNFLSAIDHNHVDGRSIRFEFEPQLFL